MSCDICDERAEYEVYASYELPSPNVHPVVNRYPQPMIRSCGVHLVAQLDRDVLLEGSTLQWVIKNLNNNRKGRQVSDTNDPEVVAPDSAPIEVPVPEVPEDPETPEDDEEG